MKTRACVAVFALVALLAAACGSDDVDEGSEAAERAADLLVEEQLAAEVEPEGPQRIVSLNPTGTEMLFAVGAGDEGRAPAAGVVAALGMLDLDDVGAKIGKQLPGPGAGQDAGKFDDADAGKRSGVCLGWPGFRGLRHGISSRLPVRSGAETG